MKRVYFLLVLVLVVSSFVSAISLEHEIEDDIIIKEYANELDFLLRVSGASQGYYNIYTLVDVYLEPSTLIRVNDSSDFELDMHVTPMDRLLNYNGSFLLSYYFRDRQTDERFNDKVKLKVLSIADVVKVESDFVNIDSDEIVINVRNTQNIPFGNLSVRFDSVLFDVKATFDLPADDTFVFRIPISNAELRKVKSGTYIIDVTYETPRGEIKDEGEVYLKERKDIVTENRDHGLIYRTSYVSKVNTGNTVEEVTLEVRKDTFSRLFTSFSEEPQRMKREGSTVYYSWTKRIAPSEVYTVRSSTNYLYPLLIIIVIIIVIIALRRYLRAKIVVTKQVSQIKTRNGEFALRVRMTVKAKTLIEDVSLVDSVPRTVKVYKKGMTSPDEVDTVNRKLKWTVSELNSGEERDFSYVVYSRVRYVGRFYMPPSVVRYKSGDRVYESKSNSIFFSSQPEDD